MVTIKKISNDRVMLYVSEKEFAIVLYYYLTKQRHRFKSSNIDFSCYSESISVYRMLNADFRILEEMLKEFQENYEKIRDECFYHLKTIFERINDEFFFYKTHFPYHVIIESIPIRLDAVKITSTTVMETVNTIFTRYYCKDRRSVLILFKYFRDSGFSTIHYALDSPYYVEIQKKKI